MPVKWSALKVNDAMDMVEEFVNQAIEPLELIAHKNGLKISLKLYTKTEVERV